MSNFIAIRVQAIQQEIQIANTVLKGMGGGVITHTLPVLALSMKDKKD